ncbi:MAG: Fe-Mn family superoxide dismutase [Armatimonadaceae bacterium]
MKLINTSPTRRLFLKGTLAVPAALALGLEARAQGTASGPFTLPALPYGFDALEPHVDTETMQIHHGKHHQAYVNNLNAALAKVPALAGATSVEALIRNIDRIPEEIRTAVRNNGGGHANHSLFWKLMKPGGGGAPTGAVGDAIRGTFGSFEKFQAAFEDAGVKRFGSGWAWLAITKSGKLEVFSTPNQDSPIMDGGVPILGNDVWEHAYYLKYRNRRPDYLKAWWNTVNWDTANEQMRLAKR